MVELTFDLYLIVSKSDPKEGEKVTEATKALPVFFDGVCSAEFILEFGHEANPCILCHFCGRVNFSNDKNAGHEHGELDDLLNKQKIDPQKYIAHNRIVDYGFIGGKQLVIDCPCGFAPLLEKILWSCKIPIANYLGRMSEKELATAQTNAEAVAAIIQTCKELDNDFTTA